MSETNLGAADAFFAIFGFNRVEKKTIMSIPIKISDQGSQRKLRFRIWHKGRKKFIENGVGTHCYSQFVLDAFTGEVFDVVGTLSGEEECRSLDKETYYIDFNHPNNKNGFVFESPYIVQQFIGIEDSQGIDIYEGDLVEWSEEDYSGIITVEWLESNGSFNISKGGKLKVVGNIFEGIKNK